jgi:hypothetical protein
MSWRIEYEGHTLAEAEVTFAQVATVGELLGGRDDWTTVDPNASPQTLAAWIAVCVCQSTGEPVNAVLARLARAPMADLLAAVKPGDTPVTPVEANPVDMDEMLRLIDSYRAARETVKEG